MQMENSLKKFKQTGIRLLSLTTNKFKEVIDGLVRDRKINKEEGRHVLNDFLAKAKKSQQNFEQQMNTAATRFQEGLNRNTRNELQELRERVSLLENKLNLSSPERQSQKTERLTMESDPLHQQKREATTQQSPEQTNNLKPDTIDKVRNSKSVSLEDEVLTPEKKMEAERQRMQQPDRPASPRHEKDTQKANLGEAPLTPDKKMEDARKKAQ